MKLTETKMIKAMFAGLLISSLLIGFIPPVQAQTTIVRNITFPTTGKVSYGNDFGAPRDGGARTHEGNDIMGAKMMPLVAAVNGKVRRAIYPEADYGYAITIQDKDGYTYHYLHVNNDTPGTDDKQGGGMNAYAADVYDGQDVVAGQLLGFMGDSGNAETTQAHVHFEIRKNGEPINPYHSLQAATKLTQPVDAPKDGNELLPFGNFQGGSSVAIGNVDSDRDFEILVGAGPGGGPHVQVLELNGSVKSSFFPYDLSFTGGVDVAFADIDDNGKAEIVTSPRSNGGPHVKIFDLMGKELHSFMAYDTTFTGGVNITAADVDDEDGDEIITAPGKGGGPHVRIFKPTGEQVSGFFAYDADFTFGIDIAAGISRSNVYIATTPYAGSTSQVKVFDEEGDVRSTFLAYESTHLGGARISIGNMNRSREPEIVTVPTSGGADIKMFSLAGRLQERTKEFEPWWIGSWDISVYEQMAFISVGPNSKRRASIREIEFD